MSFCAAGMALLLFANSSGTSAQTTNVIPNVLPGDGALTSPNPTINFNPPTPPALSATAPITLPQYNEPTGPTLSIDQAVLMALKSNTQALAAALVLKRITYEMQQITGEAYPQISVSASDTYSNTNESPGGVVSGTTNLNTAGVTIPTITDAQSGSLFSSSSTTAQSATTSTGGSSTTSSTTYLNPVTGPAGGTSSSASTSDALSAKPQLASTAAGTTGTSGNSVLSQFETSPFRLNNYGAKLSLSQVVDVNGLVSTSEKVLRNEVDFYELDLQRIDNEVAYDVKNQYFAVLRAEQQLGTDQEQVTNTQAELTDSQNKYDAGTSPEFDVVSAQTQLSSAQQALIDAEITLDVQRATLNNLLNLPLDTPFSTVAPGSPSLPTAYSDSSAIQIAYANRPELQQSAIALDIAKKIVKLDRSGQLPQVALSASVVYDGYAAFPYGRGTTSSVSAGLTLPLFDGGQTAALVNEAHTDVKTQQVNRQTLLNDIALEVRTAYVNVRNGAALVDANTQGVAEARESLRLANIRYKAGTGTLLEVTNAEADLATGETNLATAQYQLQTAYASLLRSEGLR
jgi:outer membrane protein